MKRVLFFLSVITFNGVMFGQTLSSYSTVSVDFSDNEVYGSGIYYQKTIGMYPQMTISYFDATYNGDVTGFLSII